MNPNTSTKSTCTQIPFSGTFRHLRCYSHIHSQCEPEFKDVLLVVLYKLFYIYINKQYINEQNKKI